MSIGDSLLNYFNKEEIENLKIISDNKKLKIVRATFNRNFKIYDKIQFWWFNNDKNYKIVGMGGELDFENHIEKCKTKQEEISLEITNTLNLSVKKSKNKNPWDKTKKSIIYHHAIIFSNDDLINVQCYEYSKYIKDESPGTNDHLKVMLVTKKMEDHFNNALD